MFCQNNSFPISSPPLLPIFLGYPGENDTRPVSVDVSAWLEGFPDGKVSIVYTRADKLTYVVVANATGPVVMWKPERRDLVTGACQIQLQIQQGDDVKKEHVIECVVGKALDDPSDPPQPPRPTYVEEAIDAADRAEAAVEHYPQIRDGYWWVWDVASGEWVNTGVKATGEGGTSADAVLYTPQDLTDEQQEQARSNIDATKLFVVNISSESEPLTANKTFAETYAAIRNGMLVRADLWNMDGDLWLDCMLADPTQIIFSGDALGAQLTLVFGSDESLTRTFSRIPTDAVLYTEQTITPAQQAQARKNIGAASIADIGTVFTLKGGVATVNDLPQTGNRIGDVWYVESVSAGFIWITSTAYPDGYWEELGETIDLSTYAEKTWVQNQGFQTAQDVQTAIAAIPDELPAVAASDNGKFLRVVNGAWAAQAVPSAESNSFGGGA